MSMMRGRVEPENHPTLPPPLFTVGYRMRRDIRFEANISEYEANQRILHAKRKNGSEYSLLGHYFQKEPYIN